MVVESVFGVGNGGILILKNMLDEWYGEGVDCIVFEDGMIWIWFMIWLVLFDQVVILGNDVIVGFNMVDMLIGKFGDDMFFGGNGLDIYIYWCGDGYDLIIESINQGVVDWLEFVGIMF